MNEEQCVVEEFGPEYDAIQVDHEVNYLLKYVGSDKTCADYPYLLVLVRDDVNEVWGVEGVPWLDAYADLIYRRGAE